MKLLALFVVACSASTQNAFVLTWDKDDAKESAVSIRVAARSLRKLGASSDVVVLMKSSDEYFEDIFARDDLTVKHGELDDSLVMYERVQVLDSRLVVTGNPENLFDLAPDSEVVKSQDDLWRMLYPSKDTSKDPARVLDMRTMNAVGLVSLPEAPWYSAESYDATMKGARAWWMILAQGLGYYPDEEVNQGIDEAFSAARQLTSYYNSTDNSTDSDNSTTDNSTDNSIDASSTADDSSSTADDSSPTADASTAVAPTADDGLPECINDCGLACAPMTDECICSCSRSTCDTAANTAIDTYCTSEGFSNSPTMAAIAPTTATFSGSNLILPSLFAAIPAFVLLM